MKLRPHQEDVIRDTRKAISEGYRNPLIFAPCSFGKTLVAAEIARLAVEKGNKVLFLVHRRLLATQTKEKFDDYGLHNSIIMADYDTDFTAKVMITTVQTYSRRLDLAMPYANQFFHDAALVFCDEAHLGISDQYTKIYSFYKDRVIIGLTGSPARGDQRPLGEVFDIMVSSIGIKELTDKGFLAPIRYFAADAPDLTGVKITAGDYNKGQLEKKTNSKKLVGEVVENWLKLADNRPTIVFSTGVKHSIHLKEQFEKYGIPAEHLDSHSPHETRLEVLDRFRNGDLTVLTNCNLFCEGLDADFVSCLCIAKSTLSLPLWIQMAGRAQRICEGKEDALLLDFGGNIERHGLLTDDVQWTLEGKDKAWSKAAKPKEKLPVRCRACNFVFDSGSMCPECSTPLVAFGKSVETIEAELKEIEGKNQAKPKASMAEKRVFFGMLEYERRMRHYAEGWSAHKFQSKFGCWPKGFKGMGTIQPDAKFFNWITYQNIRYHKSKEKAAA